MSRTVKAVDRYDTWNDERRPQHQQERGPRHGNHRKMYAGLKVRERRIERARNKREVIA